MAEFTVLFKPQNVTASVKRGTDILTAAAKAGIILRSICGGEGVCGKCKVIIEKGAVKKEPSKLLTAAEKAGGYVLACESLVESDLVVTVPEGSFESFAKTSKLHDGVDELPKGATLEREGVYKRLPLVQKFYLELPEPTLDDNASDLDRITRELEPKLDGVFVTARLASVKHLGGILRESAFKITATVAYHDGTNELLAVEPGDTTQNAYAFAFDIGTTTVAGQLIRLSTGEIVGSRMSYNKQARFGADVITRIIYGSEDEGLESLSGAVIENINEIVGDIAKSCNVNAAEVAALVLAGNTTMAHLLLKIDPTYIRRKPYIPTANVYPVVRAGELGIAISPKGIVYCLPGVASYIGGDIVAGVLACGLFESDDVSLLIDIGTNGELVLGNKEWMIGCSASAGPAFEGSGLSCGMKAVKGAIQKVSIQPDGEPRIETIDGVKAKGICGSGYIDLLRELFRAKLMTRAGKLNAAAPTKRVRRNENCLEYVVTFAALTQTGADVVITEDDIENLKRAKGAIYSALWALLGKVGKDISEVKRIYIGGGFGNYINCEAAIAIGLLPDVERSIYRYIGNSSLAGARMALLSRDAYKKAFDIYKAITYVDLSSEPAYMDEYIASLFFPHTDMGRFPSVRS